MVEAEVLYGVRTARPNPCSLPVVAVVEWPMDQAVILGLLQQLPPQVHLPLRVALVARMETEVMQVTLLMAAAVVPDGNRMARIVRLLLEMMEANHG